MVFVCNGHFTIPRLPDYYKKYKKEWIHSHNYMKAKDYHNKTVAIVGGGPSGIDIVVQLNNCAKQVYFLHKNHTKFNNNLPLNCIQKAPLIDANSENLILLNKEILSNIDVVIYCTGYKYSTPPIFEESKSLIEFPDDGSMVSPLFWHMAHLKYLDSLFFIGLNLLVSPFILIEHQVRLAIALMNHRINFDLLDLKFEQNRIR